MRVRLSTRLAAPPEWVLAQLQSTQVFRHITAPLVRFAPAQGAPWPEAWTPGELCLHLYLFGLLPMGRQVVRISLEPAPEDSAWPTLRDNGEGTLMRVWDHRITVHSLPDGHTWYTDDIDVQARYLPWLMTPLSAAFAQLFYRHRQRRWRSLVARQWGAGQTAGTPQHCAPSLAATALPTPTAAHRRQAFEHLLHGFSVRAHRPAVERWQWLEAAHVLGQPDLRLHWRSHVAMLRHALQLRDYREIVGQLARLALAPLGNGLARLPQGNPGRANVSAFEPMVPAAEVSALICQALDATIASPERVGL